MLAHPLDKWVRFTKIYLQHLQRDSPTLLYGEHAFVVEMGEGNKVNDKVEKGLEFIFIV